MSKPEIYVPDVQPWECLWFPAEFGFVFGIPPKIMWWAYETGLTAGALMHTLVLTPRTGEDQLRHHLMFEDDADGPLHLDKMKDLLERRMAVIERRCLDGKTLLRAAAGEPNLGKQYVEHQPFCIGSCVNQYQYLRQFIEPFLREYQELALG